MQKVGSEARRIALPSGGVIVARKSANYLIACLRRLPGIASLFGIESCVVTGSRD